MLIISLLTKKKRIPILHKTLSNKKLLKREDILESIKLDG